ncbi:2-hydroxychromene-2-carboxylate isomerase [Thalassotalea insulae]|uniref:2-hydroxychromene-2-carboxylate isomerase n=1 Tax=Thalassotalea insulae TaxID=2056778 RepID=A0ABQ6GPP5_9GAMM|nr:DsbA family protein [Thalassotalea insulae]GLX77948.1 2-hydroxychromene-2-carboxylate isomerase [Thalassotalea insulae]
MLRKQYLILRHYYLAKWFGYSPKVEVYLALQDPYSFMLVQVLADLAERYRVQFKLYLVYQAVPGVTIAPGLMQQWALKDANFIASQYQLTQVKAYPNAKALLTGQQLWQLSSQNIETAVNIFHQTWFDQYDSYYSTSTPVINFQVKNLHRLVAKGHYLPGALLFAGEWFLGVDRLSFFEDKLLALGLNYGKPERKYLANQLQFITAEDSPQSDGAHSDNGVIEAYISLRSPYSYLGFVKAKKMAAHYQLLLVVKPVLPLMMRGFDVSHNKQKYLYLDAYREAQQADIDFRGFVDPLGKGIIDCYQLVSYADSQGKAIDYIEQVFQAIYVDGLDVANPDVIKEVCRRLGLNYQHAMRYNEQHDWQQWVDNNQVELEKMGFWGVPCFKYRDISCWGQDRLVQIEQAIQNTVN